MMIAIACLCRRFPTGALVVLFIKTFEAVKGINKKSTM